MLVLQIETKRPHELLRTKELHPLLTHMCCVGEMIRKLHVRPDIVSLNPHTTHMHILCEKLRVVYGSL
jgi:hypothetical protein